MVKVFLKSGRDEALQRFHPWVFSGAIHRFERTPSDGERVAVCDVKGNVLAIGHYNEGGSIAVRILYFGSSLPENFWEDRLQNALALRERIGLTDSKVTNAWRLCHGEGDGLPGLIIDFYNGTAVFQAHSAGMFQEREVIVAALRNVLKEKLHAVYDKSRNSLPDILGTQTLDSMLWGEPKTNIILENGHTFSINWETGQKTGFFLDQRENRRLLGEYAKDRSVFNGFCYSGGFSVYALQNGAKEVQSVDVSNKAIDLVNENIKINGFDDDRHQAVEADVVKYLHEADRQYEVMILDPPAFAKSLNRRHNAVQGYKRLNIEGMKKVAPGGILFTFSCSQVIDRDLFYNTITAAAMEVRRPVRVLHHLSQSPDHPVSLFHPEGSYLKGLVLEVG